MLEIILTDVLDVCNVMPLLLTFKPEGENGKPSELRFVRDVLVFGLGQPRKPTDGCSLARVSPVSILKRLVKRSLALRCPLVWQPPQRVSTRRPLIL